MNTFIVAEAGANHNRSFLKAKELIDVAIKAKADAVKFQLYSSETLYSKFTPDFAGYKNIPKLIKDIEFPKEWHKDLFDYCRENKIEFMSTPFSLEAIDELYNLGVHRLKISAFEATDPRLIKHASQTKLPLIISLGAASKMNFYFGKIVEWILQENKNPNITFLHCNSAYPTPLEDINLGRIREIQDEIRTRNWNGKYSVGLSDHTMSTVVPSLAITFGATTIEKHFTLNRNDIGPDHPFSLEPNELTEMVRNIREAEIIHKTKFGNWGLSQSEKEKNMSMATRSIVANKIIPKGEKLTQENTTTKRPFLETSFPASLYFEVVGKYRAKKDIIEDEIINKEDVEKI